MIRALMTAASGMKVQQMTVDATTSGTIGLWLVPIPAEESQSAIAGYPVAVLQLSDRNAGPVRILDERPPRDYSQTLYLLLVLGGLGSLTMLIYGLTAIRFGVEGTDFIRSRYFRGRAKGEQDPQSPAAPDGRSAG